MFDFFAVPRVGDVDQTIARLDNGRVAEFPGGVFEDDRWGPGDGVCRERDVQGGPFASPLTRCAADVVVDDQVPSIL